MATIFLSYAHEDVDLAEKIYFALSNLKHQVFFDKESLQVGDEYNFSIIDNIRKSDFSILLLSPDFFSENSYCRTELKIIQSNWPIPKGKIFPVMARETPFDVLPNYITSVTILKSNGNLIAEVIEAIQDQLAGFRSTDSVTNKIRKLELEKQLEVLDQEWSYKRKEYLITLNDKQVTPSKELAFLVSAGLLGVAAFIYFISKNVDGAGDLFALIPLALSFISFFYIRGKAASLAEAERSHMLRRNSILKEMPGDGVNYLALYR